MVLHACEMGGDGGRPGSAAMEGVDDRVSGRGSESGIRASIRTWQGGQQGEEKRRGWVENRLAEIVELDDLWDGQEIELGVRKADETIGFEHQFEPERSEPRTAF